MNTFNLKNYLTENRQMVIDSFVELQGEQFYNGISQREFMVCVMNAMSRNNPTTTKQADRLLPNILGEIAFNNSKVNGNDRITEALKAKYNGTAYMAMV